MNSAETHALALRLYEAGRFEEALALLRQALTDGESSELWSDWATVQFRRGEAGEAEAGYRIALGMNPNETQAAANLGGHPAGPGPCNRGASLSGTRAGGDDAGAARGDADQDHRRAARSAT
jgi:tetratricopeptide (TPR) repeat protein